MAPSSARLHAVSASAHAAGGVAFRRAVNGDGGIGKRRRSGLRAEGTLLRRVDEALAVVLTRTPPRYAPLDMQKTTVPTEVHNGH